MEFGMPTLLALDTLRENAVLCRALGLSFVEINMNLPMYQIGRLREDGLPRVGDVYFTMHLDENMNPFDFNPLVREAYRRTALDAAAFARENGVPVLNMHIPQGVHFKLPGEKVYLFDRYFGDVLRAAEEFGAAMARSLAGSGTRVCLENTSFSGMPRVGEIMDALLGYPCFSLTYDAGHDLCDGMAARAYYEARADKLLHMHLHDAGGGTCHLPLGAGNVEKERLLAAARARGARVVAEIKTPEALAQSVSWLKERNLFQ